MKRFQFVIQNPKTKELKMRNIERRTFNDAVVDARIYTQCEWENTGDTWDLVAIYDMDYEFDLTRPTRG
jgi:ubiquinone biosynthesis protein Coq4